jgi:Transcriptional repressor TCF25
VLVWPSFPFEAQYRSAFCNDRWIRCADYYAARARQWEFVLQLAYCTSLPLPPIVLPNFTYSLAFALWNIENSSMDAAPAATSALVRALLLYPHCLRGILEACGIGMDTIGVGTAYAAEAGLSTSHCEWSTVLSHPHFIDCGPEVPIGNP